MKARFCGRERELRLLNANLEEAGGGRGVVTALVGEPGVGKSRLASEHAEHAREQGFRVAWGRAWEAGGAPAYWPLRLLFEELCAKPSSTQAHALSTIRGLGNEEHQQRSDPSQARFEVFDEAASLVLEEAEKSPLLCILDDVHAADLASIELLTFLITRCQHHPIAWVLSWRHVEAHAVRVATAMSHLSRHSTVVPLERLTENETLRLLDNGQYPP